MKKIILIFIYILYLNALLFSKPVGWNNRTTIIEKGASSPSISFNRNHLFAAYQKNIMNNSEIFFIRSTNEGKTWLDEKKITTAHYFSEDPQILLCNNHIYIFWTDHKDSNNEIYFTHSEDPFGNKFSKPIRITSIKSDSVNPVALSGGNKIILIWSDDLTGDYELYVKQYNILENKWSDTVQITKFSGGSFYASLTMLMDEFYLVWQQKNGRNLKIMYSKSDDAVNWAGPVCISDGLNNAYSPYITTFPGGILCVFQGEKDYKLDIYLTSFNSSEEVWSIPIKISDDLNIERFPIILSTMNGLHMFWCDLSTANHEIIYKKSADGLIWSDKINLSVTGESSENFKAVYNLFNDSIYLIWEEANKGKICFKKSDRFCPAPVVADASHKKNEWSVKRDVSIKWKIDNDDSGIKEYAYIIDHKVDTIPKFPIKEYPVDEANFYNLNDGIWYFHLNAKDCAGNISKTIHYQVMINSALYTGNEKYYVIKYGDTLWNVSKKFYKKPTYYPIIAEYNNISDPELIYPHQILKIPPENIIIKR